MTGVENDVIPFGTVIGNRASLGGLNLVGLRRANHPREAIHDLRAAYKLLFDGEDPPGGKGRPRRGHTTAVDPGGPDRSPSSARAATVPSARRDSRESED